MKNTATIAIGLVSLVLVSAAQAQTPQPPGGPMPPRMILRIVHGSGLEPVSQPTREGGTYVVRALSQRGLLMRVVVDARSGQIRAVNRIVPGPGSVASDGPLPPYGPPPHFGQPPAVVDDFDAMPPAPMRPMRPPPPAAHPPRATASASPPLPRPRPANVVGAAAPAEPAGDVKPATAPPPAAPTGAPAPPADAAPINE